MTQHTDSPFSVYPYLATPRLPITGCRDATPPFPPGTGMGTKPKGRWEWLLHLLRTDDSSPTASPSAVRSRAFCCWAGGGGVREANYIDITGNTTCRHYCIYIHMGRYMLERSICHYSLCSCVSIAGSVQMALTRAYSQGSFTRSPLIFYFPPWQGRGDVDTYSDS